MVAAVANGGKVLKPRLVDRIEPQDNDPTQPVTEFPRGVVRDHLRVSQRTLKQIREAMLADVEDKTEGTGRYAAVPGIRICAKTGTAQVTDERNRVVDQTTWFASYAPYEEPRYVVLVMVESGISGGGTCGPVAREIYTAILKQETYRAKSPRIAGVNR
jgi:cell division protein FtsI/penicillin-binding protein 2